MAKDFYEILGIGRTSAADDFTGASVILDLVERMDEMKRELAAMRQRFGD